MEGNTWQEGELKDKPSCIFYRSWKESIDIMPDEDQLQAYRAIIAYGLDGEIQEGLSVLASVLFKSAVPILDNLRTKWLNSLKGGAPKGKCNNPNGRRGGKLKEADNTKNKPKTNRKQTENKRYVEEEDNVEEYVEDCEYEEDDDEENQKDNSKGDDDELDFVAALAVRNDLDEREKSRQQYNKFKSYLDSMEATQTVNELTKALGMPVCKFNQLKNEILSEWGLCEKVHKNFKDMCDHLCSTIRKRLNSHIEQGYITQSKIDGSYYDYRRR